MATQTLERIEPTDDRTTQATSIVALIERASRDASIDVQKMATLMEMYERATARASEERFNQAMAKVQSQMQRIQADATNPQTKSKYATYAALDRVMRPIYTAAGFGLSFDTGEAAPGFVRVVAYVTHEAGGSRTYHIDMPADGKGAKGGDVMTLTHAVGAGASYGMRYLLKMIWNVAVGEDDRDGNDPARQVAAPDGYDNWIGDMQIIATEQGLPALTAAWKSSKQTYRDFAAKHQQDRVAHLKATAKAVKA